MKRTALALIFILALLTSLFVSVGLTKAQSVGYIIIGADGSVTGANSIQQVGNTYFFTAKITGNIKVQTSNIVIDGAGYTLNGNGGLGIDLNDLQLYPSLPVSNVTIENLYITNCGAGILSNGGGNFTFYDDYLSDCKGDACIMLIGASYNNVTYCTIIGSNVNEAIGMMEGASYNSITENNLAGGINMFLSANQTVDKNYWSDYLTKYTNATEIDKSGIGNQPYLYYSAQNTEPNGTKIPIIYQDNHPLMKPVVIPLTGSSPQPSVPEFPVWTTLLLIISVVASASLSVYFKKHKR